MNKLRHVGQVLRLFKDCQLPVGPGALFQHLVHIGYAVPAAEVVEKGRLGPGQMVAVDLLRGEFLKSADIDAITSSLRAKIRSNGR